MNSSEPKLLRVAAYARVSTDHEDQLNSLAAQRVYFDNYIKEHTEWNNAGIFADEGLSGTSTNRPEFHRMINLAKAGGIDLILTKEVSRFARNTVDTLSITRELKNMGVGVLFLTDNIDTRDNDGEFRLTIMASVAQEESRKISQRTRWGQTQAMKRGVVFGNNSLFGYHVSKGKLTIHPEQAEVVRLVYHKFLVEGKGSHIIARELTEAGYASPLRGMNPWSSTAILRILRNEKYTGDLLQQKYRTTDYLSHRKIPNDGTEPMLLLKNHHEAIISHEMFQQAQEELERRHSLMQDKRCYSSRHWYSGKIFCGHCGSPFKARTSKRKSGQRYRRFDCRNRSERKTEKCPMRGFNGQWLELCGQYVLSQLSLDRDAIIGEILHDLQTLRETGDGSAEHKQDYTKEIQRQQTRRDRALEAYLDGDISKEAWIRQSERCDAELARLEKQRLEAEKLTASVKSSAARYAEIRARLEQELDGGPSVLDEIIEKIVVQEDCFHIYVRELPIYFSLTVESQGSGLSYRSSVTSCSTLPREAGT